MFESIHLDEQSDILRNESLTKEIYHIVYSNKEYVATFET